MFSSNTSQVSEDANYIEQVFATHLYTGNGTSQTINNGIDLAGEGGLVWLKSRSQVASHGLFDTLRGANNQLLSDSTASAQAVSSRLDAFTSSGFTLGSYGSLNGSGSTYASWTFRKQPKFFDCVTYTGNGATNTINHNLGAAPGCIIIKSTSIAGSNWFVYHRSLGLTSGFPDWLTLNGTGSFNNGQAAIFPSVPTSTSFQVGSGATLNQSGQSFVAYLFAHDAGGFGLTGTDNVISCGSYTGNGSATGPTINLGFEPQWLLLKNASASGNYWHIVDNMRGWTDGGNEATLLANTADSENGLTGAANYSSPTSTGFKIESASGEVNTSGATYIYIAIRRGPMKTPTTGTSVFAPVFPTSTTTPSFSTGWPVDLAMHKLRASASFGTNAATRLQGTPELFTSDTAAESTDTSNVWSSNSGYGNGFTVTTTNIGWMFRRAPGFMDTVCYTGTGVARTVAHNLTVAPELMIVKRRDFASGWNIYHVANGNTKKNYFSTGVTFTSTDTWNSTTPTSSVFTLGTNSEVNGSGATYVAYLFASCPGVSKVGSYTGTGTTQQINCGFTGGARFVLIKRTDSTGDWYVWDSARGIVAGNDPYLLLNSTAAEVTSTDYVDTYSAGFEISSTAPAAINASGGSFIFLAIA